MGTTLLGVDLDESPVGGLVERLLSEEELEMLADGGHEADEETGGGDDTSETDETQMGTDLVDDAVSTDDDATSVPVGTSGSESTGVDTPSPGTEPSGLAGGVPSPGDDDSEGGWKEKLRPILLKGTVVLAVLAVVGFVAYRYLGTAKDKVSDKIGSDEDAERESRPTDVTGDAPEARRRAKAPSQEEFSKRPVDETVHRAEGADGDDGVDDEASDSVGRPRADSDVGALVGLAALAIVAAAVRKFGEERPRDPLVDGPADDDE